jgi:hypothetical protein
MCLYCIVYLMCFISAFVLFYCSVILFEVFFSNSSHSKLHPFFQVSCLKKVIGTKCHTQTNLPELDEEESILLYPQEVLDQ